MRRLSHSSGVVRVGKDVQTLVDIVVQKPQAARLRIGAELLLQFPVVRLGEGAFRMGAEKVKEPFLFVRVHALSSSSRRCRQKASRRRMWFNLL